MIEIPLTKGKVAIVDDCDAYLAGYKWIFCMNQKGNLDSGYAKRRTDRKGHMFMHHAIIGFPLDGFQVDHIDGNKLNNCRDNLRIISRRENMRNKPCHRTGNKSSKFVGVCYDKIRGGWIATITVNSKQKYLGRFSSELEASNAYQFACKDAERIIPRRYKYEGRKVFKR